MTRHQSGILRSFLRRHFEVKRVVVSRNVRCFLGLLIGWSKFLKRHDQSELLSRSRKWRVISIEFLRSFLRLHLAGKPVAKCRPFSQARHEQTAKPQTNYLGCSQLSVVKPDTLLPFQFNNTPKKPWCLWFSEFFSNNYIIIQFWGNLLFEKLQGLVSAAGDDYLLYFFFYLILFQSCVVKCLYIRQIMNEWMNKWMKTGRNLY